MAGALRIGHFLKDPPMIKAKTLQDLFKRYRRPGDLVFALAFMAFSLFLLFTIDGQVTWHKGTRFLAQPAFVPWLAVVCMVLFGALHLLSSVLSPRIMGRLGEMAFWLRAFEYVAWFMVYVLAVPRVGYLLSSILFCVILTLRLGYRAPRMLLIAACFGIAVVLVFKTFLQVKVPGGAIYETLPTALRSFMLTYF